MSAFKKKKQQPAYTEDRTAMITESKVKASMFNRKKPFSNQAQKPKTEKLKPQSSLFQREDTEGEFIPTKNSRVRRQSYPESLKKTEEVSSTKDQSKDLKSVSDSQFTDPGFLSYKSSANSSYSQNQQSVSSNQFQERQDSSQANCGIKEIVDLKELLQKVSLIGEMLEAQYETLESGFDVMQQGPVLKQHTVLFHSKYFRFQNVDTASAIAERYDKMIQCCQILQSKLRNRIGKDVYFHKQSNHDPTSQETEEKFLKIYVDSPSTFLLFFKHFFSKPFTLCNQPPMRKLISVLWDWVFFKYDNIEQSFEPLKLWVYGISLPSSPVIPTLHKAVLQNPASISRVIKMADTRDIYVGINDVDSVLRTPLMLAVESDKEKAIQKLIKSGSDPFLSPWTESLGKTSLIMNQEKNTDKSTFQFAYPQYRRKQPSPCEYLLFERKTALLADCFYYRQLANIKNLKKIAGTIREILLSIPDCTLQIHWKTLRGILSFKELPQDIVSVFKKGTMLRVDYHVDSIESGSSTNKAKKGKTNQRKHYTLLLKVNRIANTDSCDLQFYEIRHHESKIVNRLQEIDLKRIDSLYQQFASYPFARNFEILSCKGFYKKSVQKAGEQYSFQTNIEMSSEQLASPKLIRNRQLSHIGGYEKYVYSAEMVNYSAVERSEIQSLTQQSTLHKGISSDEYFWKVKSKREKISLGIQCFICEQEIQLGHLRYFLKLLFESQSATISRLITAMQVFEDIRFQTKVNSKGQKTVNFMEMLPFETKIKLAKDFSLEVALRNINYVSVSDAVFNVELKAKEELQYDEDRERGILQSLNETQFIDEGFSINVSQFLGKTQKMLDLQDIEARQRFDKIINDQLDLDIDEDFTD